MCYSKIRHILFTDNNFSMCRGCRFDCNCIRMSVIHQLEISSIIGSTNKLSDVWWAGCW